MILFAFEAVGEVEFHQQTGISAGPEGSINLYASIPEAGDFGKLGSLDCNESLLPTANVGGYEISIEIFDHRQDVPERIGERESTAELRADYEGTTGADAYFTLRYPETDTLDTRQGLLVVPVDDSGVPNSIPTADFVDDSSELPTDWPDTEPYVSYYLVLELAVTADPFEM